VNRTVLSERLAESLPDRPDFPGPALMVLDLDGFKDVNDTFGHAAGDELLVIVAGRLQEVAPSGSVVARLGGDEFAMLVPRSSEAEALGLASEICARVDEPGKVGGETVHVTASVGVLVVVNEPESPHWTPGEALRRADNAMYEAKRTGRNRYVQYRRPVGQLP
jgi:diguanylate cyclase